MLPDLDSTELVRRHLSSWDNYMHIRGWSYSLKVAPFLICNIVSNPSIGGCIINRCAVFLNEQLRKLTFKLKWFTTWFSCDNHFGEHSRHFHLLDKHPILNLFFSPLLNLTICNKVKYREDVTCTFFPLCSSGCWKNNCQAPSVVMLCGYRVLSPVQALNRAT